MSTRSNQALSSGTKGWRTLFLTAALYDLVLGAVFFFFFAYLFQLLQLPFAASAPYIQITAAYVFVQGVGYWLVYRDLSRNRDLVKLGVVYKAIYILLNVYYIIIGQLPSAIFAAFALGDVIFLAGFVRFLRTTRS